MNAENLVFGRNGKCHISKTIRDRAILGKFRTSVVLSILLL